MIPTKSAAASLSISVMVLFSWTSSMIAGTAGSAFTGDTNNYNEVYELIDDIEKQKVKRRW